MDDALENLEWWEFDVDHNDYFLAINKSTIKDILEWKESQINIYNTSYKTSLSDIKQWMRKRLVLSLLWNDKRKNVMSEAVFEGNWKASDIIRLYISERLLKNLETFQWTLFWDAYEYRYNIWWDKINFYVNNSYGKRRLQDNIGFLNEIYKARFYEDKQ